MALNDLTTTARAKEWWSQAAPGQAQTNDTLIVTEVTRVSSMILSYLDKGTLLSRQATEIYSGTGQSRMMLRRFPITSISKVQVGQTVIPASINGSAGWVLSPNWDGMGSGEDQILSLIGYTFCRGSANVAVTYTAGYLLSGEAQTVPAVLPFQVTPAQPFGLIAADAGVVYAATGLPLAAVAASPATGQYVPPNPLDPKAPTEFYQFAAGDTGLGVLLSYSFVPASVESACAEVVAERLSYRTRIGQRSKSLGGQETTTYNLAALPDWAKAALQSFKSVVPIA